MRIFLIGFMGAGKTTVGRTLARKLDWRFVDLDREIERRAGQPIADIFERSGEEELRRHESEALEGLLHRPRLVLATGGGTFTRERNVKRILRSGVSVWIDPPFELLAKRLERSPRVRPLFRDREAAARLWRQRRSWYQRADLHIETTAEDNAEAVAERVIDAIRRDPCVT